MRIVQISDTHLSAGGGVTAANFEQLIRFVDDVLAPDLVVNTGDVIMADPDRQEDRRAARQLHDTVRAPLRVIPGNHDVGEVGPEPWQGLSVTAERVAAHRRTFGDDRWLEDVDGWAVLGLNSQLLSSDLAEEEEHWAWLAGAAARTAGRPTLLFTHKPLFWPRPGAGEPTLALGAGDRDRLQALFEPGQLRAVGSGHLHRYRRRRREDVTEVWAPSTAFLASADGGHDLPSGLEQLGVVEYRCEGGRVDARFRSVPGLDERDVDQVAEMTEVLNTLAARADPTG